MAGTTIWQARKDGWSIGLKCDRRREGLKSAKPCIGTVSIDLSTLIAVLGPEAEVSALQTILRCPLCGTDRIELRIVSPPLLSAGEKDAEPRRRKMRAVASGAGTPTLRSAPGDWIVFKCDGCGRRGEYRKARLLDEFEGDIQLPTFLAVFAYARGCTLAKPNPNKFDLAQKSECRISYDIGD